jgi:hypothetical protein
MEKTVQVKVVSSVDDLLALVVGVVADVKAGKSAQQVVSDALPLFVTALGEVGQLPVDVANRPALENTVALKLAALVNAVVG